MAGSRIIDGKFALLDRLGTGPDGMVYAAEQLSTGRHVALKLLHRPLARRHLELARSAARICHENVVEIHDLGVDAEGNCFIVMELVQGEALDELVETRGGISETDACVIVLQVLAALDAAHTIGIGHGQLGLTNVLVMRDRGDRPSIKVINFGATALDERTDVAAAARLLCALVPELPFALSAAVDEAEITGDLDALAARLARFVAFEPGGDSEFPLPATRERLGREALSSSSLEHPRFPRAPETPRDAALLAALPAGDDPMAPSEHARRRATTEPAPPSAPETAASAPIRTSSALWATLGGFAFGLTVAWAAGLF